MFSRNLAKVTDALGGFRWVGPVAGGILACIPTYFVYDHFQLKRLAREYEKSVRDKCYFDISIGNRYAGRIVFGLYSDIVPLTCENFIQLCKGYRVKDRVIGYQNTIFHIIKPGSAIAGRDVLDGAGKTRGLSIYGEQFPDENFEVEFTRDGDLAMCNWGKNTNSSVFMITLSQQRAFTNHHVCFGTVLKGMRVVREIGELGTKVGRPALPIRIVQCGVLEDDAEPPPPPSGDWADEGAPVMTEDLLTTNPAPCSHPEPRMASAAIRSRRRGHSGGDRSRSRRHEGSRRRRHRDDKDDFNPAAAALAMPYGGYAYPTNYWDYAAQAAQPPGEDSGPYADAKGAQVHICDMMVMNVISTSVS
eukprot:s2421_g4.t1